MALRFFAACLVGVLIYALSNFGVFVLFIEISEALNSKWHPSENLFFAYYGDYALSVFLGVLAAGFCFPRPNRLWGSAAVLYQ